MTPARTAVAVLAAVALGGLGVVVGDLLVADDGPREVPPRAAVEIADGDVPDAQVPALSVVSIGGEPGGQDPGDGTGTASDTAGLTAADLGQDAIDIDAFEAFDAAAEDGADPEDLPSIPGGPLVEELDDDVYAPVEGDEGTVDDLPTGTEDDSGEGDTATTPGPGDDAPVGDGPADVERPAGVPALDPDVYDVDIPPVLGFDDPCAIGSLVGCPRGIPAVVLGSDPVVPLRLGSVAVHGTETFHRNACTSLRSRDTINTGDGSEPVVLAITTNQEAELEVTFEGGSPETRVATPEAADVALAQFVAELRDDGRSPSEGPGSVVSCVIAPTTDLDAGLLRGKAVATVGDQRDSLGFELRLAGSDRSRPISLGTTRLSAPVGSTPFTLTVPQGDPTQELAVVGFVPLDGPGIGPANCAAFDADIADLRSTGLGGRDRDDGTPALPWVLSPGAAEDTRVSPYGTFPVAAGVEDGYDATYRGYLPQGSRFQLCAWWFDLEEDGDVHRIAAGAPSDTATLDVRTPVDVSAGVYVTAITLPEPRPPGHYNLYLVKPGAFAICRPAKRPAPFPVGPVGEAAASPFAESRVARSESDVDTAAVEEAAPGTSSGSETLEAADLIPAGRHEFGPRQAQLAVRICVPRALAPVAVPMVKSGSRPYVPGSPPIPLGGDLPLVPEALEPPPIGKTFPVVARDGAVLELTVVNAVTARQVGNWFVGSEEPLPPATVRSAVAVVGEPSVEAGEQPGTAVLSVRFSENVDVRARLTSPASDDPVDVCTTGGAPSEATSPNGPDHELAFRGLCAGTAYGFSIEATDADGTTTTFEGGSYRVPPNAGFFDIGVEVTSIPDGGAQLGVADVQFLRQPGVVSLSARARADDLLGDCLAPGDPDTDETLLTSFGEQARIRVRVEGSAGCEGGAALRLDSTLELGAADLTSGPVVFDVTHPTGLTLQVTITPRAVT